MSDTNTEGQPAAPAAAHAAAPAAAPATEPSTAAAPAAAPASDEPAKPGASGEGEGGKQDTEGKPAEPTYEYQMPEGMELDTAAADSLTALAKEKGLSPADAQKVAEIGVQMMQRQADAHAAMVQSWIDEVKGDKEIGGDKLTESLVHAKRAVDFIGDPALKELLEISGYGNNPVLVRAFVKLGKHLAPDQIETGSQPANGTSATRMYSASNMNP